MNFQCFLVNVDWHCFCQVDKMEVSRWQHGMLKGAHVHGTSVSVAFGAPCAGTILGALSECSKYVTFSNTFGAPVLQTTVCVAFGARRRSVPPRLLETSLATWAANAGQEFRSAPAPSGITSPRSPRSASGKPTRPHHEHFQTCQLISQPFVFLYFKRAWSEDKRHSTPGSALDTRLCIRPQGGILRSRLRHAYVVA